MKQRGLLLDRDGVINEDHGYVGAFEDFAFKPGIFPFLRRAQEGGYRLAVVTNQSGVARGLYTRESYEALTQRMREFFASEGVTLDLVLACFTHPEGTVEALRNESFWRKPNPGMILEAALRLNLDLARSVLIGDKDTDMQAGLTAGVGKLYLIGRKASHVSGVRTVGDFKEIEL